MAQETGKQADIKDISIDVIIPTYKPDERFIRLLELLGTQTRPVSKILIINTEKEYYDRFFERRSIPWSVRDITEVIHIKKEDFDHGGTRRMAVQKSKADIFVMMTQDALPYDNSLIKELTEPLLLDPRIAVSYARQLAAPGARETEKYTRKFNYPAQARVKSSQDLVTLGIKTYFCSNVCAAYNRKIYDQTDGFIERTIFNEDMIMAATLVKKGYCISYTSSARVYHSHNYTCVQQFRRNFDLAVSQTDHPEVFKGISSEKEGTRLVKDCIAYLKDMHMRYLIPGFVLNCGARFLGYRAGRRYKLFPKALRRIMSAQPSYWK